MSSYEIFLEIYLIYKLISLPRAHERHKTMSERTINPFNCVFLKSQSMKTKLILSNNDIVGLVSTLETDRKTLVVDLNHIFKTLNVFVYENFLIAKLKNSYFSQEKQYRIEANRKKVLKYIEFNKVKSTNQNWVSDFSFITEFLDTKMLNILSYMLILSPFEILSLKLDQFVSFCEDITLLNETEQLSFFNNILEICFKCNNKMEKYMEKRFIIQFDTVLLKVFNFFKVAIQKYYNCFILSNGVIKNYFHQLLDYYKEYLIYLDFIEYKVENCWLDLIINTSKPSFEKFIDQEIQLYCSDRSVLISGVFTIFDNCLNSLKKIHSWELSSIFEIILSKYILKDISLINNIYLNRIAQKQHCCLDVEDFVSFKTLAIKFIKKNNNSNNKFLKKFDHDFSNAYMAYVQQLSDKVKQELEKIVETKETYGDQISGVEKCSIKLIDVLKMGLSFLKEIYVISDFTLVSVKGKNKKNSLVEQKQNVFLYYRLITYYSKHVVNHLMVYITHLNNGLMELFFIPKINEDKVLESIFLIFNSMVMCLKLSNELENIFLINKKSKERHKINLSNAKTFFYQVDAVVTESKHRKNISVFLNEQRLFTGKNRLHIQTLMSCNTLIVTCQNTNGTKSTTCNLLLAQKNDRISINFNNKALPNIELRINDIVKENCELSFYIKIYKSFVTTMLNNSLAHYVKCFFSNSNWNHIISDFKKYELQDYMSELLKTYFFNILWQQICCKLYHDVMYLTKAEDTFKTTRVEIKNNFDKLKQELEDCYLKLEDITCLKQLFKINKYYKLIITYDKNKQTINSTDNIEQNNHKIKFLLSIYTEKKDTIFDKIQSNNSLEGINIFSNKSSNSTNKINENKENNCQSYEGYENYAKKSLITTNDGRFNIQRKYVDKDLIDFTLDGY